MDYYTLWENDTFIVSTPYNPNITYSEGMHIVISPKRHVASAWEDSELTADAFKLAAQVCKIAEACNLSPWFNIQANGNWGLLPGRTPSFHVHIMGRNKTDSWGKSLVLPDLPGTYDNSPMPEADRNMLTNALKERLA